MLARPQVWVFLHPRTPPVPPLCPTGMVLAGSSWSHQPQTGCLGWILVLPGGVDGCTDMGAYPGLMPGSPSAQPDEEGGTEPPHVLAALTFSPRLPLSP